MKEEIAKKLTDEQIEEICKLMNNYEFLQVKKILRELPEITVEVKEEVIKKNLERLKELEEFSREVKRLARETGRSFSVPIDKLEELFVRYRITQQ